jgi:hypothetical protein
MNKIDPTGYDIRIWKGYFFNDLIQRMKYDSYLELGIGEGNTWRYVNCNNKVGVDTVIHGKNIINCTTDDFFEKNDKKFDIIYIDADHSKLQVWRDYISGINSLNENGIMFFHDINPPDKQSTAFTGCGDVYDFWMNLCDNYKDLYTITSRTDGEDTLGILIKKTHQIKKIHSYDRTWEDFDKNKYIYSKEIKIDNLIGLLQ